VCGSGHSAVLLPQTVQEMMNCLRFLLFMEFRKSKHTGLVDNPVREIGAAPFPDATNIWRKHVEKS
jgi:hypothetical protein